MLSLAWVGLPSGVFLALGAVVRFSCRVWPSGPVVWFRPPDLFLPFFLKEATIQGTDPRTRLSTGTSFTTDVLKPMYHCRGIGRFYSSFPIVLSFLTYPVETLRRPECRPLRQMRYLFFVIVACFLSSRVSSSARPLSGALASQQQRLDCFTPSQALSFLASCFSTGPQE